MKEAAVNAAAVCRASRKTLRTRGGLRNPIASADRDQMRGGGGGGGSSLSPFLLQGTGSRFCWSCCRGRVEAIVIQGATRRMTREVPFLFLSLLPLRASELLRGKKFNGKVWRKTHLGTQQENGALELSHACQGDLHARHSIRLYDVGTYTPEQHQHQQRQQKERATRMKRKRRGKRTKEIA